MERSFCMLVLIFLLVPSTALAWNEPPRTKPPAADRIPALVAQLGSSEFARRKAATRELGTIGLPALPALRAAMHSKDAEVRRRARGLVSSIENSLETLLADYRSFGLPLLAKEARLAKSEPDEKSGRSALVFFYPPSSKHKLPNLPGCFGLIASPLDPPVSTLDAARATRKEAEKWIKGAEPLDTEEMFALAIQCKALGWDTLANVAYRQWRGMLTGSEDEPASSPRRFLAERAWLHWRGQLGEPDSDWSAIARRLSQLRKARPEVDTKEERWLITALEAALVPSKAKPGSIEAMIDDLIAMNAEQNGGFYRHGYSAVMGFRERRSPFLDLRPPPVEDKRYLRLVDQGFAAVPALLEHVNDIRLTRSFRLGFNNFHTFQCRVQDIVGDLLQGLAGEELGADDLERIKGYPVDKAAARAWWEKAKKVGEEAYLVAHVLPPALHCPSRPMLRILARKYPHHLPRLYQLVLEKRPEVETEMLADFLAESALPRAEKREAFVRAARCKDLRRRAIALTHLQPLDSARFVEILVATLDALPRTPEQPYWHCPEIAFAPLVQKTEDSRAWKALDRAMRRADAGLRLQLMDALRDQPPSAGIRKRQIALLAAFLDDTTARDEKSNPKLFDGPYAAFNLPRLEVRNLAAMKLRWLLDVEGDQVPTPTWLPAQWADLRQRVRQALERERRGR